MPNLCIDGAAKTLDFYKRTFSAAETVRVDMPADKIGRAEIMIGDSPSCSPTLVTDKGVRRSLRRPSVGRRTGRPS
jgi:PhnB protein